MSQVIQPHLGQKKKRSWKQFIPLYLMLLPGFIYLFINNYLPMGGIVLAFKNYNYSKGIFGSSWNGLKNFTFLFKTRDAWTITRNTIAYNLVFIVVGNLNAIIVAIILSELKNRLARKSYQTLILLPFLISTVIMSYIVYGFLSTQSGLLNQIIRAFGGTDISWYSTGKYWPVILVVAHEWRYLGYNSIVYYSSILGIDPTYYEAAAIDGASRWQRISHILLPCIRSTIIILVLMNISKIFYSDFGLFYQVTLNSGPIIDYTNTIDTYVYRGLVSSSNLGMTAAAGLYQSVVGFILVISANAIVRRIDTDSALY